MPRLIDIEIKRSPSGARIAHLAINAREADPQAIPEREVFALFTDDLRELISQAQAALAQLEGGK